MSIEKLQELIEYKQARFEEYKKRPRANFRPDIERAIRIGEITGLMIAKNLLDGKEHKEVPR